MSKHHAKVHNSMSYQDKAFSVPIFPHVLGNHGSDVVVVVQGVGNCLDVVADELMQCDLLWACR